MTQDIPLADRAAAYTLVHCPKCKPGGVNFASCVCSEIRASFIEGSKLAIDTNPLIAVLKKILSKHVDEGYMLPTGIKGEIEQALNNVQVVQPDKTDGGEQQDFYYKMGMKCEQMANELESNTSDELWNSLVAKVAAADICKNTMPTDAEGIDKWKLKVIRELKQSFILISKK